MAKRSKVTFKRNGKNTFIKSKRRETLEKELGKPQKEKYTDPYDVRDTFIISMGNLEVLKKIPEMMLIPKWRNALRRLYLDFICEETLKRNRIRRGK